VRWTRGAETAPRSALARCDRAIWNGAGEYKYSPRSCLRGAAPRLRVVCGSATHSCNADSARYLSFPVAQRWLEEEPRSWAAAVGRRGTAGRQEAAAGLFSRGPPPVAPCPVALSSSPAISAREARYTYCAEPSVQRASTSTTPRALVHVHATYTLAFRLFPVWLPALQHGRCRMPNTHSPGGRQRSAVVLGVGDDTVQLHWPQSFQHRACVYGSLQRHLATTEYMYVQYASAEYRARDWACCLCVRVFIVRSVVLRPLICSWQISSKKALPTTELWLRDNYSIPFRLHSGGCLGFSCTSFLSSSPFHNRVRLLAKLVYTPPLSHMASFFFELGVALKENRKCIEKRSLPRMLLVLHKL
jgi:hypothetical protein